MEGLETRELKFSTQERRWLRCRNSKQARRVLGTREVGHPSLPLSKSRARALPCPVTPRSRNR